MSPPDPTNGSNQDPHVSRIAKFLALAPDERYRRTCHEIIVTWSRDSSTARRTTNGMRVDGVDSHLQSRPK